MPPVSNTASGSDVQAYIGSLARAVLVVFAAFLCAFALVGLGAPLLASTFGWQSGSMAHQVAASVLQFVGFGVGVAGYLALTDQWEIVRARVPSLRDLGYIAAGVVVIFVAAAAAGRLLSQFGVDVAQNQVVETGRRNPRYFLYMIPITILFVGPFEELVFRGAVQGTLRKAYRPMAAVVIASGMFGVVHWIALTGGGSRVSYVLVAGVLGLVLGYAYEKTANLVVPSVIHGLYNAVLFGIQYAASTGLMPA